MVSTEDHGLSVLGTDLTWYIMLALHKLIKYLPQAAWQSPSSRRPRDGGQGYVFACSVMALTSQRRVGPPAASAAETAKALTELCKLLCWGGSPKPPSLAGVELVKRPRDPNSTLGRRERGPTTLVPGG